METRCPLCRAGTLSLVPRDLVYEGTVLAGEAHVCSGCREMLLDSVQLEALRGAIRCAELASNDADVEEIVRRAVLKAEEGRGDP